MAHRIEVGYKGSVGDVPGEKLRRRIRAELGLDVVVRTHDVYTIDRALDAETLAALTTDGFIDPVTQVAFVDRGTPMDGTWAIEVGYKPGVTDNVGRTAREVIEAVSGSPFRESEGVYTSRLYFFHGEMEKATLLAIAEQMLANTLIQRYTAKSRREYEEDGGMGIVLPKVEITTAPVVETFDMTMAIEELLRINRERTWALSREELGAIQRHFLDPGVLETRKAVGLGSPTDVELEVIAQTWSEHCKHKIFNATIDYREGAKSETIKSLFKTYVMGSTEAIRAARGRQDFCLSVFKDNAGVIRFNRKFNLAYKVETHNTPSALDPYGGALTGIVGVNRDPFGTGKGAKLIFNTDIFCFAAPDYKGPAYPRLLHPKRVLEGVREGVEHGGNKSGIPTVNGSLVFDDGYLGKPLVFCGTCGIMPATVKGEASYLKRAHKGDAIVMVGGKIGKDGIHGATFSSEELSEVSPTSAVQIGDPITQKRMTDFLLLARDRGLYTSITDNGAGGLSSSVGEMATDTNGCILHLDRAPLKYHGLSPWEILLSEAQERMNVSVSPGRLKEFLDLSKAMNVQSTVLGEFTDTGILHVLYNGKTVAYLDMSFLHDGLPTMHLSARWEHRIYDEAPLPDEGPSTESLTELLKRWNVCSKEYVVRQYDHEVQGGSVLKPLSGKTNDGPSDSAIVRPDLGSMEGIVVSHGICPKYSKFDTYHMVACAIDEAIRNNIASGGSLKRLALLDNFCWSDPVESEKNPEGPYKLAQLVRANKALFDYATLFGTPFISGKDSMKNDYTHQEIRISVPQTVLISAISVIPDVRRAVTMEFKEGGQVIAVIGRTYPELGGSEYFSSRGRNGNIPPRVRGPVAKRIFQRMEKAIGRGLIRSCHDISDGGLACALAESAFAGGLGAEIDLSMVPSTAIFRDDFMLFSESQSRFVVTVAPGDREAFHHLFRGLPHAVIGRVRDDGLFLIKGLGGSQAVETDVARLREAWQSPFKDVFSA